MIDKSEHRLPFTEERKELLELDDEVTNYFMHQPQ